MNEQKPKMSKCRKIVAYVLLSLCAAVVVYCVAVMIYRLCTVPPAKRWSAVTRFLAEFGFACLLSLPAFDLRFAIFSWRKNAGAKAAGMVLRVVSCAFCAMYIALMLTVVVVGTIRDDTPVENVCVLGLALNDGEMAPDLVHRLDAAARYKTAHPDACFIVTGGNGVDPDYSEAAYMKRYLLAHGFADDDKLIAETNAKTTVENFEYVAELVDKKQPLGVVTSNLHMFRATRIAKKQGYAFLVKIPAYSEPTLYLENVMWEGICSIFETLGGHMAL